MSLRTVAASSIRLPSLVDAVCARSISGTAATSTRAIPIRRISCLRVCRRRTAAQQYLRRTAPDAGGRSDDRGAIASADLAKLARALAVLERAAVVRALEVVPL